MIRIERDDWEPGWLVFGMFFAVIPLSNALIAERQQGTLRRLRTIAMPRALPLLTKLVPYFLINLVQACLMLAAGVYLVPALGGAALALGSSPAGLLVISTPDKKQYTDIPGTQNEFHEKELYFEEFRDLIHKYFN